MPSASFLTRAGEWFLHSGIQEPGGGVARYYRADLERYNPVSTEITGYTASALVYLHSLTGRQEYLERAIAAARFLAETAWNADWRTIPFETEGPGRSLAYFFDCGIIVRGLLAVWRAADLSDCLAAARALAEAMERDFASPDGAYHPIVSLPSRQPAERDPMRWSRAPGCYQLKAAMAWWDLWEVTGAEHFRESYERVLEAALTSWNGFLPGHTDRHKVMDRLHAFLYFLEGLLPRAKEARPAAALREGIALVAGYLGEIGPEFARSDVYAQLLRMRILADGAGAAPLDREAAQCEAAHLASFQVCNGDPRMDGGFYFGRKGETRLPYVNPVSTAFALQALAMWDQFCAGGARAHRHQLI